MSKAPLCLWSYSGNAQCEYSISIMYFDWFLWKCSISPMKETMNAYCNLIGKEIVKRQCRCVLSEKRTDGKKENTDDLLINIAHQKWPEMNFSSRWRKKNKILSIFFQNIITCNQSIHWILNVVQAMIDKWIIIWNRWIAISYRQHMSVVAFVHVVCIDTLVKVRSLLVPIRVTSLHACTEIKSDKMNIFLARDALTVIVLGMQRLYNTRILSSYKRFKYTIYCKCTHTSINIARQTRIEHFVLTTNCIFYCIYMYEYIV